ncbi:(2Fe-2S) ferredoxin domain-containing protein [Myroides pelagicus]|uniref:(2Fe-2S) ferredoxin domain-containing protein n=1 Tax=Myroides pelagicus TaxID=270914 RepID=A0A7K1GL43_9FLAO|nr:(2Fe-2S) ferredoxin domain-containing protein [Myroides pelagicus]MEC4113919.1 (2Fe-2S) ferredoxin domain-containing protein [Myroides pelagicus]MTH29153.1 (2Fe-2S) ferredoxin domain-containing protein [Myroides pelagicus]
MGKVKKGEKTIFICDGKKCCRYNQEVKSCLKELFDAQGDNCAFSMCAMKCQGMCKQAPVVYVSSHDKYKKEVGRKKAKKIFEKYVV